MITLYEQALVQDYAALHPVLQQFHGHPGATWQGRAEVRWTAPPWLHPLLWLGRLPGRGADVPVSVTLHAHPQGERWVRRFAGRVMASFQQLHDGHLSESFGPFKLRLQSTIHAHQLQQRSLDSRALGLRLPRWLALGVIAHEHAEADQLHFDVAISLGRIPLLHYRGWLKPAEPTCQ